MGKKKSLGSSPIGRTSIGDHSYNFIRDLGVASHEKYYDGDVVELPVTRESNLKPVPKEAIKRQQPEKKIVSYYLELELIERMKVMADDRDTFYSALVSEALEIWIEAHGY